MANLAKVLDHLRQEQKDAERSVSKLNEAIKVIERLIGRKVGKRARRPNRTMSAAGRRRISQAQKARWAKWRKGRRQE
jgi:hypothetical protein